MTEDIVAEGRNAWQRLREAGRRSWDDWMAVARALVQGRAETMQEAKANRPFGSKYNTAMGAWLRENGFAEIDNQQRYRALVSRKPVGNRDMASHVAGGEARAPQPSQRNLGALPAFRGHAGRAEASAG
jgi:hypothetical protein